MKRIGGNKLASTWVFFETLRYTQGDSNEKNWTLKLFGIAKNAEVGEKVEKRSRKKDKSMDEQI